MSFNLDVALDEVNRLPLAGDLVAFLVEKTHDYFGVEVPAPVEPEAPGEPEAPIEPVSIQADHESLEERKKIAEANVAEAKANPTDPQTGEPLAAEAAEGDAAPADPETT